MNETKPPKTKFEPNLPDDVEKYTEIIEETEEIVAGKKKINAQEDNLSFYEEELANADTFELIDALQKKLKLSESTIGNYPEFDIRVGHNLTTIHKENFKKELNKKEIELQKKEIELYKQIVLINNELFLFVEKVKEDNVGPDFYEHDPLEKIKEKYIGTLPDSHKKKEEILKEVEDAYEETIKLFIKIIPRINQRNISKVKDLLTKFKSLKPLNEANAKRILGSFDGRTHNLSLNKTNKQFDERDREPKEEKK